MIKNITTVIISVLIFLTYSLAFGQAYNQRSGGVPLPQTCSNGQVAIWNSTTRAWDTCFSAQASGSYQSPLAFSLPLLNTGDTISINPATDLLSGSLSASDKTKLDAYPSYGGPYVPQTTQVNGHALSGNVTISASDLTTGTLPHGQLPTLISGDIPNNAANTTGAAASLSISGQTGLLTFTGITSTSRIKTIRDADDTILELGGSYTPTGTWNLGSMSFTSAPWITSGDAGTSVNQESTDPHEGSYSARFDYGTGNYGGLKLTDQAVIPLISGTTYTLSFWYKTTTGNNIFQWRFNQYKSGDEYLNADGTWGTDNLYHTLTKSTTWTQFSITFTADRSPTSQTFSIQNPWCSTPSCSGTSSWVDDFSYSTTTTYPTNVWGATLTTQPTIVYFNGVQGQLKTSADDCTTTRDWYWASNILYVYSTSDPTTAYINPGIEASILATGITNNGKSYVTIQGLTLEKFKTWGISYSNSSASSPTNGIIDGCTIRYIGGSGIMLGRFSGEYCPNSTTIKNCSISYYNRLAGTGNYGIKQDYSDGHGGDSLLIQNNTIMNDLTYVNGVHPNDMGISVTTGAGTIIEHNTMTGVGHGIEIRGAASGVDRAAGTFIIRYNRIGPNADDQLYADGITSTDNNVYYNIFSGGENNVEIHGGTTNFYNNVFDKAGMQAFQIGGTYATTVNVKNNIFTNWSQDATTTEAIYAIDDTHNPSIGSSVFDHNLYYHSSGNNVAYFKNYGSDTFAKWKTDSGQDANSVNSSPLFVSTSDFHLWPTSPAIGKGVNVSLTTDYYGIAVKNPPDIGAIQFDPGLGF